MVRAIVMAGGRSERMRAGGCATHKALVRVLGLTLVERNLHALLSWGYRDIVVVTSRHEAALGAFVRERGAELESWDDARVLCYQEDRPRGTIGVVREFLQPDADLLVVNVDNLTTLSLPELVDRHRRARAAFTLATHRESFRNPFGVVEVVDGMVTAYTEKPEYSATICSGTYVVGTEARKVMPAGCSMGVPELFERLHRGGAVIASYPHAKPWIDVNDEPSVHRAEKLILEHADDFERWKAPPDREICLVVLTCRGQYLVLSRGSSAEPAPLFPQEEVAPGASPDNCVAQFCDRQRLGNLACPLRRVHSFDHLLAPHRLKARYHIYHGILAEANAATPSLAAKLCSSEELTRGRAQFAPQDERALTILGCLLCNHA